MKQILVGVTLLLLAIPLVMVAQRDCGNGLPCGAIPWPLPKLPILISPTPMPTSVITPGPTPTSLATLITGDVFPTVAVVSGLNDLSDQFKTLAAVINATSVPVVVSGTPVSASEQLNQTAGNAGVFFGYVHGFSEINLGGLTPFVIFTITAFLTVITMKSLSFILPVVAAIFGLVLRVVQFIIGLLKLA